MVRLKSDTCLAVLVQRCPLKAGAYSYRLKT
jgi:hypothetical protein